MPVWKILCGGDFELIVANAAHIKNVPGRKTDVNDAMWIADLLAHGLIRSSFVPPSPIQELRALTRKIGIDMSSFPTPGHLVCSARLCPRNDKSAEKRRSRPFRKRANCLNTTLVAAA
jgi:transposase